MVPNLSQGKTWIHYHGMIEPSGSVPRLGLYFPLADMSLRIIYRPLYRSQKQQTGLSQGKKGSKQKSRKAEKQNETRPMPTYIWKLAVSHFAFLLFCFSALTLFSPVTNLFVASDLVQAKGSKQKSRKAEKQNETRPMPTYIWKLYNGTTVCI
jgi:ribosomal protein L39E